MAFTPLPHRAERKPPRVKFVLPISVRGGVLVEEPEDTRVALAVTKLRSSFKLGCHA
jgi:hypothetical protein